MPQVHSFIYVISNTENGKQYIGRTKNPTVRWRNHKNSKTNQLISRAIRKHGFDKFQFEVIYAAFSIEETLLREEYFIRRYNSHYLEGNGYNLTYSASGAYPGSVPWNKGKTNIYTKETLDTMSNRKKNHVPWNKGKKGVQIPSEETRKKLSESTRKARNQTFWSTKKIGDSVSALPDGAS